MLITSWQHPQAGPSWLCVVPLGTQLCRLLGSRPVALLPSWALCPFLCSDGQSWSIMWHPSHQAGWELPVRAKTWGARRGEGGGEWKDNSAANAWAGWDASDELSLFLQMLLILVLRSWMHFWKHLPPHWTCKIVRCGACILNYPEKG